MNRTTATNTLPTLIAALLSACAVAAVAGGCAGPLSPQARQLLESTYASYDAGDDALTISRATEFLAANASSPRAAEAWYLKGMAECRSSDRAAARQDLQAALDGASAPEVRAKAALALADLAHEDGDMALAENMYRAAVADAEEGSETSGRARYRLGCVLQRQGRWKEADSEFDRVVFLFADADLASAAARRTHGSAWTVQAGAMTTSAAADTLAKALQARGTDAEVAPAVVAGKPVFVVTSGRFATHEEAVAHLPAVSQVRADAFVTVTR
jgi:tetratricopeptide (TPR) repeat protein